MQLDQNTILAVLVTAMGTFWLLMLIGMIFFAIAFNTKKKNNLDILIFSSNIYGITNSKMHIGRKDKDGKYIICRKFTGKKIKALTCDLTENHMYNANNRKMALIVEKDGVHSQLKFNKLPENLGIEAIRSDVFSFLVDIGKELIDKYAKKDMDLNKMLLAGTFSVLALTIIFLIVISSIIFTIGPDAAAKMQDLKTPNLPG